MYSSRKHMPLALSTGSATWAAAAGDQGGGALGGPRRLWAAGRLGRRGCNGARQGGRPAARAVLHPPLVVGPSRPALASATPPPPTHPPTHAARTLMPL